MNIELIKKYAQIQTEIKAISEDAKKRIEVFMEDNDYEEIKNQVLEEMMAERQKTLPTEYGNVTVREVKSYEYPDYFLQETDSYKLRKKEVEKDLRIRGKYSIQTSLQLAGKPKQTELKLPSNQVTIH